MGRKETRGAMMNKENNLTEYKRELSSTFERSVVSFLNSNTGGHIYIGIDDDGFVCGAAWKRNEAYFAHL